MSSKTEIVEIRDVEHTGRKTGSGDPILKVTLVDGRSGSAFDGRFLDLDVLDKHEVLIRNKGDFNGKPDLVFNLPKEIKPIQENFAGTRGSFGDPDVTGENREISAPETKRPTEQLKEYLADEKHEPEAKDSFTENKSEPKVDNQSQNKVSSAQVTSWNGALEEAQIKFFALTGKEIEAKIEAGFAQQAMEENPTLKECEPQSIANSIIQIARTGMTLNPALQLAHLIPRNIKGKLKCCLDFTYRGYVKILKDYGCVRDIQAVIVYEDEEYEEGISQTDRPVHKKKYAKTEEEENKREILGVYCRVILPQDNLTVFTSLTPTWKILKAQKMSKTKNKEDGAWHNWKHEMFLKTKIKSDFKTLIAGAPKSAELSSLELETEEFTPIEVPGSRPIKGMVSKNTMKNLVLAKETSDATIDDIHQHQVAIEKKAPKKKKV